jgi:hypothetical protein
MDQEIGQLPPSPSRGVQLTDRVLTRTPSLEWMIGQASRHTVGRPALRAFDAYSAAANRLLLVAPNPVLDALEDLSALLARLAHHDEAWRAEWHQTRKRFVVVARAAVAER